VATNDVVARLAQVPMFSGCSKKELTAIARTVRDISHPAGTVIATEGEPGAGLFVIEKGEADVTIGGKRVNHLKDGDFFGEMALLGRRPAHRDGHLHDRHQDVGAHGVGLRGLLVEHPSIALRTLEAMASRLR
jgi:CRP-like cAMP-binding protein